MMSSRMSTPPATCGNIADITRNSAELHMKINADSDAVICCSASDTGVRGDMIGAGKTEICYWRRYISGVGNTCWDNFVWDKKRKSKLEEYRCNNNAPQLAERRKEARVSSWRRGRRCARRVAIRNSMRQLRNILNCISEIRWDSLARN